MSMATGFGPSTRPASVASTAGSGSLPSTLSMIVLSGHGASAPSATSTIDSAVMAATLAR
jgi:hypothetical protein